MQLECPKQLISVALVAIAACIATPARAQTPTATVNVRTSGEPAAPLPAGVEPKTASPVNPWLSAQVAYKFGGAGNPADSFLISARALYWLSKPEDPGSKTGWGFPIMANFTGLTASTPADEIDRKLSEVAGSAQGMWAGAFPYWRCLKDKFISPTVFAGLVPLKVNAVQVLSADPELLYQGTATLGVELAIGEKDGRHLLTVSGSGTYALPYDRAAFDRAFPNDDFKHFSAEVTAVMPISDTGLGVLVEGVFPEGATPGFRAGLIVNSEVGK